MQTGRPTEWQRGTKAVWILIWFLQSGCIYAMQQAPHVSDMTGPQAKERTDGVELCPGLCLASMFPKKHMPEHIIQRGMPKGGRRQKDGGFLCSTFQTPGCGFLCPSPVLLYGSSMGSKRDGLDQSDPTREGEEERPGREAAPKIVDHCPSASSPRVDFVSEVGLDLSMGSVLHCSSKEHNTSQPLSDSLSLWAVWLSVCV